MCPHNKDRKRMITKIYIDLDWEWREATKKIYVGFFFLILNKGKHEN